MMNSTIMKTHGTMRSLQLNRKFVIQINLCFRSSFNFLVSTFFQRLSTSMHGSNMNIYDSWRSQRHAYSEQYYDPHNYPQKAMPYPPDDYMEHHRKNSMNMYTYNPRRYHRDYEPNFWIRTIENNIKPDKSILRFISVPFTHPNIMIAREKKSIFVLLFFVIFFFFLEKEGRKTD